MFICLILQSFKEHLYSHNGPVGYNIFIYIPRSSAGLIHILPLSQKIQVNQANAKYQQVIQKAEMGGEMGFAVHYTEANLQQSS